MRQQLIVFFLLIGVATATPAKIIDLDFPIQDPFLASVWGYLQAGKQSINTDIYPQTELKIKLTAYYKKPLTVILNQQSKPAPLAIFIPGSFGPMNRRQPKHMAKVLLAQGYTVIRMPNTLSTEYLEACPKHQLANFMESTSAYVEIITKLYQQLQQQNIITTSKITILGVSHGGFLATVIAAKKPTIFTKVLSFSPPINIFQSTVQLDNVIQENAHHITLQQILNDLIDLAYLSSKEKLSNAEQLKFAPVAKDIITFATFQQRLLFSIKKYLKQKDITYPFPAIWTNLFSDNFWQWRANLQLIPILKKFAPKSWQSYQLKPQTNIQFWAEKLVQAKVPITILSAQDDFINSNQRWTDANYLLLLKKGSHYGYRYTKWFDHFLKQVTRL